MYKYKFFLRHFSTSSSHNFLPTTRFQDKIAIVTSSTSGIGFAIAKRLGLEGAKVSISGRKEPNIVKAVDELRKLNIKAMGTVCDVTIPEQRKNLLEQVKKELGGIDFLVPATATSVLSNVLECEEQIWEKIFEVNLKSIYLLAKEALPYILARGPGGRIVFVSSIAAYTALDLIGPYSVSKAAVAALTKMAAYSLASSTINVNAVAPGIIQTDFSKAIREGELGEKNLGAIPLKRYGTPEDVAAGVAFLVSEDASYLCGEVVIIAGGMSSRL